jgi:HK97 family phage prohead protease
MEADFSGWATRFGLKCSDGRTITKSAFEHMDNQQVPLLWQHGHNNPENVLGHAKLEARDEGIYAHAFFNDTPSGQNAKLQVEHGDIKFMSIWANQLVEKSKQVLHGMIREVSLVISGANPGATIEQIRIAHGDGVYSDLSDEVTITTGFELELKHSNETPKETKTVEPPKIVEKTPPVVESVKSDELTHAGPPEDTDQKVIYDSLNEAQKEFLHFMVGVALEKAVAEHSDNANKGDLAHKEGADSMSRNVFDQTAKDETGKKQHVLSHDDLKNIFEDAQKHTGSLKAAVEKYAEAHLEHGITDIDVLFPDAKMATGTIELDKRRTEWVSSVLNGTRKTPFTRIKTFMADLTQDEARARGYIKGNYKLEEWFGVTKRTTGPTTIYKKQKLDRDDMLDITDFDIVSFLKAEMRLMTEEEIARAILIGDGRQVTDEDKIKEPSGAAGDGLRSVYNDHELFVTTVLVNVDDADSDYEEVVDAVMDGMEFYKGTGTPDFYTTIPHLNKFLKARDDMGRRYYANKQEVADALGVRSIITVEPMKELTDLIGIVVNLDDYNVGTDRGGELTMFDDFDIDYNQQKYLLETRLSGALIRPKSALVVKKTAAANVLATPSKPTFNATTGVVTIPTVTGVVYKGNDGTTTLTAGAQTALAEGASTTVYAVAATGYYFRENQSDSWSFTRNASA